MAYTIWTDKDLEKCRRYVENITFEQVGIININGIYSKKDAIRVSKKARETDYIKSLQK